jgi:hypothetical protein
MIDANVLTVISLGDSRWCLPRDEGMVSPTFEDMPDVPEEAQPIPGKGGSVKDGRGPDCLASPAPSGLI